MGAEVVPLEFSLIMRAPPLYLTLIATLYLEFWRRRNYVLQWEWDVLQFEKEVSA